MHREDDGVPVRRGQLRHGNPSGKPAIRAAVRGSDASGAFLPGSGAAWETSLSAPRGPQHEAEDARRVSRIRAANTKHGRFSAEGQAVARWCRMYFRNGYRSLRALGSGTVRGMNGRDYFERLLAQEEAEGIAPALVEARRLEARAAVVDHDVQRLRAKGRLIYFSRNQTSHCVGSRVTCASSVPAPGWWPSHASACRS